jgi:hypothetical protein
MNLVLFFSVSLSLFLTRQVILEGSDFHICTELPTVCPGFYAWQADNTYRPQRWVMTQVFKTVGRKIHTGVLSVRAETFAFIW